MSKTKAAGSAVPIPVAMTRAERVVERLLKAATQHFMEKGYDATSMTEIASTARASKETFYRHFPTKDELFRAVVVRQAKSLSDALEPALFTDESPEKALTIFGELALDRLTTKESIAFHRVLGMTRKQLPDVVELYRASGPYRVRDAVARYIRQQIEQGRLRAVDPQVAARQFFDLFAAEMILNANLSGKGSPGRAAIQQRVREAVECFLHGYGHPQKQAR